MAGINRVILIGNLGRDPEVRHLDNGLVKASFSLATTETFKGKDGNPTDHTEWHNIVLWRRLAENAEKYLRKGSQIYLEGKIRTRKWEDKDGNTRYTTEIEGSSMIMLGARREQESAVTPEETAAPNNGGELVNDEGNDLPF
ncbi:MAG: single-stranded DNA-binding protein [Bacteroidales bacterium]|nr:single-stranded DNA-binding protein [Lentimicrobiaceae bacterium]MDD5694234.1 single-stranded DNA-binding protein [Bacteroidales bacterium]